MKTILKDKWILLDTCVVSYILRKPEYFKPLLEKFENENCTVCINNLIKLEYIRTAQNLNDLRAIRETLEDFECIALQKIDFERVESLYPMYRYCKSIKNMKQAGVVDALAVAQLASYPGRMYLLTFDNNDFPVELLDRIETGTIDTVDEILAWGLYTFNLKKEKDLATRFDKN